MFYIFMFVFFRISCYIFFNSLSLIIYIWVRWEMKPAETAEEFLLVAEDFVMNAWMQEFPFIAAGFFSFCKSDEKCEKITFLPHIKHMNGSRENNFFYLITLANLNLNPLKIMKLICE